MTSGTSLMSAALSRRGLLRGVGVAGAGLALASCARPSSGSGPTEIVLHQSTPEVIGYFDDHIEQFHQTRSRHVGMSATAPTDLRSGR